MAGKGRPFQKGVSGNPGGKPKNPNVPRRRAVDDIRALARECGPEAIAKLRSILRDPKAPLQAVIMAANSLLDRGFGKPPQSVDFNASVTPTITRESARDIIARRLDTIAERIEAERDSHQRLN
jgi:hypothetical protein